MKFKNPLRASRAALFSTLMLLAIHVANAASLNTLYSEPEQRTGSPLGGMGTGFLELWPDGCIHDWSIFNRGAWAYGNDSAALFPAERTPVAEMDATGLQFFVRSAPVGGKPIVRRLSINGQLTQVTSTPTIWLQNVAGIEYNSTYPGARLTYKDPELPVQVTGDFFSPMIPQDTKLSGTPGTYMIFTIRNGSSETQEVSLASYLKNPLARGGDPSSKGAAARKLQNTITSGPDSVMLTLRTDSEMANKSTVGSMAMSMSGGEPSWIASDFGAFLTNHTLILGGWAYRTETAMRDFRTKGRLPKSDASPCPIQLGPLTIGNVATQAKLVAQPGQLPKTAEEELGELSVEQITEIIEQARLIPSLASIVAQAEAVDPEYLIPEKHGRDLVWLLRTAVGQYAWPDGAANEWGDSMLCNTITLKPGEERQIRVVLSWYFPTHMSPQQDRNMGHVYTKWFKDAEEVNQFLVKNEESNTKRVHAFRRLLTDTNLPPTLMNTVSNNLHTLVSNSWWTEDGKMGIWEGLGCCGLNAATVYEQGSHLITALYPDFERDWAAHSIKNRNQETGRMFILYKSDLNEQTPNQDWSYVDRNLHFVWAMARDYLWFGDKAFLDTYYPEVIKSLSVFEGLDSDGDGLPDLHTNHANTYDVWYLEGIPSYFSSLWIGALRCGIRMGEDAGDTANVTKWKGILEKALTNMDAKLWNGEYYSLFVNGERRDEACMSDQIAGEIYTNVMGLGNGIETSRIQEVLKAIVKYNFDGEQGLFNATYPAGAKPTMPTYLNMHSDTVWPGTEFNLAALMIDQGMIEPGIDIIAAAERRYLRAGRFMSIEECGKRYNRPMSIYAAFLAATGFKIDVPKGILTIAPPLKQPEVKALWASSTGYGQFTKTDKTFELTCESGETTFKELRANVSGVRKATLNGMELACKTRSEDGLNVLRFDQPVRVKAGDKLTLR